MRYNKKNNNLNAAAIDLIKRFALIQLNNKNINKL